jgi:hypothetical protein
VDAKTLNSLKQALADLQNERRIVDEAITTLQGLLRARGAGGARAAKPASAGARARRKPRWTPAMRQAARDRMRKYWEKRRGSKS